MPRLPSYDSGILLSEADPECALATFPDCDELVASDKKCPRGWKTWCVFHGKCWGCDVPVLPLTPKHMYGIAAMFKSCGYRSYEEYVRAAKGMHIQSVAAWSKKLKLTFRETITMCPHNKTIGLEHSRWNRYLARDPPSYDSGIPLSEADAKIMMDKIEARRKWLKANGKAPKQLKAKAHEVPKHVINAWNRYLARDPPSYDLSLIHI